MMPPRVVQRTGWAAQKALLKTVFSFTEFLYSAVTLEHTQMEKDSVPYKVHGKKLLDKK